MDRFNRPPAKVGTRKENEDTRQQDEGGKKTGVQNARSADARVSHARARCGDRSLTKAQAQEGPSRR